MGIKYYKLFDLLNRRGMKKSDLREILSSATVAKLSKGENISGEAIEKICKFLDCQPGDIMEYVEEYKEENGDILEVGEHLDKLENIKEYNEYINGTEKQTLYARKWIKKNSDNK